MVPETVNVAVPVALFTTGGASVAPLSVALNAVVLVPPQAASTSTAAIAAGHDNRVFFIFPPAVRQRSVARKEASLGRRYLPDTPTSQRLHGVLGGTASQGTR